MEIFAQHSDDICCVLSELTMPRMDGWDTLSALRKITPEIPVILSSGFDEALAMAGEHPELPKPTKPEELKQPLLDAIDFLQDCNDRNALVVELQEKNQKLQQILEQEW